MATLNLSYEDLASVICLAAHLANADGNVSDEEMEAIVKSITDQYNFEGRGDLLKEYINAGLNMQPQEALQRIAAFGPVEKQWTSNFFVKTIVADGNLEESEKSLYWDIMEKCGLPEHNLESGSQDSGSSSSASEDTEASLALQTCVAVNFRNVQDNIFDGFVQFPQFQRKGTSIRNEVFDWFGLETLQFERRSRGIDALNEHLGLGGGWKLIMIYGRAEHWENPGYNKLGSLVAGEDVYGPVFFVLENGDKALMGFNYKSFLVKLINLFNSIDESVMVQGENNPELSRRYLITALTAVAALKEA